MLELVRYRNLTPDEIRVAGIHLVLIRHEDGSLSIHGLEQQEGRDVSSGVRETDAAPISPLLLQPDYLRLSDARVTLVDLGSNARPLHLSPVTVEIDKQGDHHKMAASLSVEKGQQGKMTLIADLDLDLIKEVRRQGTVRNLDGRRSDLYEVRWIGPGEAGS